MKTLSVLSDVIVTRTGRGYVSLPYAIGVCVVVLAIVLCIKYFATPTDEIIAKILNVLAIVAGIGIVVMFIIWMYGEIA